MHASLCGVMAPPCAAFLARQPASVGHEAISALGASFRLDARSDALDRLAHEPLLALSGVIAAAGDRTDSFCQQALQMRGANPQIIPPNIDINDALRDLQARDQLLPRIQRLERLLQRSTVTAMALGSDSLAVATTGYGLLKLVGRSEGLDVHRRDLSNRFAKGKREGAVDKRVA